MEIVFLCILILVMMFALMSGFPVAFSLPGSAIFTILLAAACGWLFEGNPSAYFAQDGPDQWLTAGVTNFRSVYWEVERDTLIAIPLFVFMGIMLQRSKIAEDLLVAMAQLFGPVPGGLGISVVFVGALLAATTGIVGATVIAMGLISLPAMLRNNYSKSLAAGTICASGTLGQIIPPSIVLIILADQLSSAADQAQTTRKADYKEATGEFSMPSEFDVSSASAGDMFMGAFIPGLVLVGIYMAYILISALIRPHTAPPVPYHGKYDSSFYLRVLLSLVPPLALIFVVLGSIVMGIATVNQAGAIGAIGAMIMAGYRLVAGQRNAFYPAILAVFSITSILFLLNNYNLNIKNIKSAEDEFGVMLAIIAVAGLVTAILWSTWRTYKVDDTLKEVMVETAKTTSMVFIILIGAAMLTSAFRGFGGEQLVREFLTGLPGGFWAQFIVVMAVIFILGFFLDFIEIAVVVVPIVAPILLADPSANITAVWLGVMIGLNIQTSFLTPPFGFALFYLRGVAPPSVKTTQIYKGAIAFILLQLVGLAVAGYFPPLVNYLPYRTYLTSDTAPPPKNPRLQQCIENYVFEYYDDNADSLTASVEKLRGKDIGYLPDEQQKALQDSLDKTLKTFALVENVRVAHNAVLDYQPEYRPTHITVRKAQSEVNDIEEKLDETEKSLTRLSRSDKATDTALAKLKKEIADMHTAKESLQTGLPADWEDKRKNYVELTGAEKKARTAYRRNVDAAYEELAALQHSISSTKGLIAVGGQINALVNVIKNDEPKTAMDSIKSVEKILGELGGVSKIKSRLSKARRALKGDAPDREKSLNLLAEGQILFEQAVSWRKRAADELLPALDQFEQDIRSSIGLRVQPRLTKEQAKAVAACQSEHKDISLNF